MIEVYVERRVAVFAKWTLRGGEIFGLPVFADPSHNDIRGPLVMTQEPSQNDMRVEHCGVA